MQKAVELEYKGLTLRGMLHAPEIKGSKVPFVAIYHGFTGNRIETQFMFVRLSRMLEQAGIGSVRFDFSGSGESDGEFSNVKASREIEEARVIYEFMASLEYADNDNLFMIGHSLGGMVASIAASEARKLKGLVLWAPAGNMKRIVDDSLKTGKYRLVGTDFMEAGGMLVKKGFAADLAGINVYGRAAGYKGNVLLIHGSEDLTVPIWDSQRYMEIYGERAEFLEITESDHNFQRYDLKEKLLNSTVEFIKGLSCLNHRLNGLKDYAD